MDYTKCNSYCTYVKKMSMPEIKSYLQLPQNWALRTLNYWLNAADKQAKKKKINPALLPCEPIVPRCALWKKAVSFDDPPCARSVRKAIWKDQKNCEL